MEQESYTMIGAAYAGRAPGLEFSSLFRAVFEIEKSTSTRVYAGQEGNRSAKEWTEWVGEGGGLFSEDSKHLWCWLVCIDRVVEGR